MARNGVLWGRIALGGFLVELVLMALSVPVFIWGSETAVLYIGVIGSLVATFLFGIWAARRAASRQVLHGVLVGVVAMLVYGAIFLVATRFAPPEQAEPQPLLYYVLGHGFKLLGGGLGGLVAARQLRLAPRRT
jgi:putative membrane protein (TIGR04086 family)